MDDDIAEALFGDFDEADFEELNDDFMLDAAKEPETPEDLPFDFAAHVRDLIEKAKKESGDEMAKNLTTVHEQGRHDEAFFSTAKRLGRDDDEESGYFDGADWDIEGAPGAVAKLNEAEEKALVDKFNETLLEYDSDDLGEGYDDEGAMGDLPLEGDALVEAALDDYLLEKNDDVFMQGPRHYMEGENAGGSGFSALVGTKMIPVKELEKMKNLPRDHIQPIEAVLGDADEILGKGRAAPPAEEIFIDGKSYFSEKMRNPWDCESILSTLQHGQ
jgi:protein LTV1